VSAVAVSNSFDYVAVRRLEGFRLDRRDCSARSLGFSRASSSRVTMVAIDGRHLLCGTRTRDFTDHEIRRTVHGAGQLYLDRSGRTDLTDLGAVRQLVLSPECRACPDLATCIGTYVPLERDRSYYEEDEAWLRQRLSGLQGRVLDAGMGQLPYLDALAGPLKEGRLEYHGVDPDPAAAADVRDTGLPLTLHCARIEEFPAGPKSFDCVVAIRSLHHLPDLARALGVLVRILKPGGRMLLVESVPLPLLRSRADSRRSQAESRGGFQHYRNWDSHAVLEYVGCRFPLRPVFHRPVGRDTCDQWILELERLPRGGD
jgi:SAM-dependent methyltransferase